MTTARLVKLSKPITAEKVRRAVKYRIESRPGDEYVSVLYSLLSFMWRAEQVCNGDDYKYASLMFYEADEIVELAQQMARVVGDWRFAMELRRRGGDDAGDDGQ